MWELNPAWSRQSDEWNVKQLGFQQGVGREARRIGGHDGVLLCSVGKMGRPSVE